MSTPNAELARATETEAAKRLAGEDAGCIHGHIGGPSKEATRRAVSGGRHAPGPDHALDPLGVVKNERR